MAVMNEVYIFPTESTNQPAVIYTSAVRLKVFLHSGISSEIKCNHKDTPEPPPLLITPIDKMSCVELLQSGNSTN